MVSGNKNKSRENDQHFGTKSIAFLNLITLLMTKGAVFEEKSIEIVEKCLTKNNFAKKF